MLHLLLLHKRTELHEKITELDAACIKRFIIFSGFLLSFFFPFFRLSLLFLYSFVLSPYFYFFFFTPFLLSFSLLSLFLLFFLSCSLLLLALFLHQCEYLPVVPTSRSSICTSFPCSYLSLFERVTTLWTGPPSGRSTPTPGVGIVRSHS